LQRLFKVFLSAAIILFVVVEYPQHGYTSAISDIDKQLSQIEQQVQAAQQKRDEAQKKHKTLVAQKSIAQQDMQTLLAKIDAQSTALDNLNQQLDNTKNDLQTTGKQLQAAMDRVTERDALLKSRLRLMYMNGSVSYMDVLFGATSFSDFLSRFDSIEDIVGQDKSILDTNKADRDTIAAKQKKVAADLANLKGVVAKAEALKNSLAAQENQKEVLIASLGDQDQATESIDDDAEKALIALAQQRSDLNAKKAELNKIGPTILKGGRLGWPVPGYNQLGDGFGMRMDPIKHIMKLHKGVDIPAPGGTPIVSAENGTVLIAQWVRGYGNTVIIDHGKLANGDSLWTLYGHIRNGGTKVKAGEQVTRGEEIAEVGTTGDSTGNHLHFEVRINNQAVNPVPYLK